MGEILKIISELNLGLDKLIDIKYSRHRKINKKEIKVSKDEDGKYKNFSAFIKPRIYEIFNQARAYAKELKISESYLSNIIHGIRKPNKELLKKISDSLDLDYKTLEKLLEDGDKQKYRNN